MYSEALLIMDRNTDRYMIDELKAQLAKQKDKMSAVISQQDATISQLTAEIRRLQKSQINHSDFEQYG